jgi:hypothetical protein
MSRASSSCSNYLHVHSIFFLQCIGIMWMEQSIVRRAAKLLIYGSHTWAHIMLKLINPALLMSAVCLKTCIYGVCNREVLIYVRLRSFQIYNPICTHLSTIVNKYTHTWRIVLSSGNQFFNYARFTTRRGGATAVEK